MIYLEILLYSADKTFVAIFLDLYDTTEMQYLRLFILVFFLLPDFTVPTCLFFCQF